MSGPGRPRAGPPRAIPGLPHARGAGGTALVAALLFGGSVAATIGWARSMPGAGMPMPGGWTMSMAWMRMPGQSWPGAAAAFVLMWTVMMVAMMLPAVWPALRGSTAARRPSAAATAAGRGIATAVPGRHVALAAAGYFGVWAAAGLAVFPIGALAASVAMARPDVARAVPFATGVVLLLAGAWQLTPAKAGALACCTAVAGQAAPAAAGARSAWRHGLRLGGQCLRCCGNLMGVLLVLGVMDLVAMTLVAAAIIAERLTPGARVARAVGVAILAGGVVALARASAAAP